MTRADLLQLADDLAQYALKGVDAGRCLIIHRSMKPGSSVLDKVSP